MEVTALRIRLLIVALLYVQVQQSYSYNSDVFPDINPSSLQFFEYESVSIHCAASFNDMIEWRVMRKIKDVVTICNTDWEKTVSCTIRTAFSTDSGEYWCEAEGKKSNSVHIIVTAGPVILQSPVSPVMEGDNVTLSCRHKTPSPTFTADFYKDGIHIGSSSTREITIHNVSKPDEGFYRCRISGAGESAESHLVIRADSVILESPDLPVREGDAATLRCRNKMSSLIAAEFYKDGLLVSSSSTGEMIIHSVSTSDEGLYKCSMSGVGESAESWMAVRDCHFYHDCPLQGSTVLRIFVSVLLLALGLVMALFHLNKKRFQTAKSPDIELEEII